MAVTRKDKLLAGYNGNLESVIVYNNAGDKLAGVSVQNRAKLITGEGEQKSVESTGAKLTNGLFVVLEGLMDGKGREVHKARLAGQADADKEVLFVHNSEVMYDEKLNKLEDFHIEAGKVARAYRLFTGDVVSLTHDLFVDGANLEVGDVITVAEEGKLGAGTGADAKVTFTIIEDAGYELTETQKAWAVKVTVN